MSGYVYYRKASIYVTYVYQIVVGFYSPDLIAAKSAQIVYRIVGDDVGGGVETVETFPIVRNPYVAIAISAQIGYVVGCDSSIFVVEAAKRFVVAVEYRKSVALCGYIYSALRSNYSVELVAVDMPFVV